MHNRRKALIYVSDGYDFTPFQDARLGLMDPNSPFAQNDSAAGQQPAAAQRRRQQNDPSTDPTSDQQKQNEEFADADLARELWDLTRTANRANVTIYTMDPRGLVGPLSDLDDNVDPQQWCEFVRKSQDSLRVIAEETGGIAVVNQNDFSKAIRRIDAETSDYYVLGFYSKNPDPLRKNRRLEVKVEAAGHEPGVRARNTRSSRCPRRCHRRRSRATSKPLGLVASPRRRSLAVRALSGRLRADARASSTAVARPRHRLSQIGLVDFSADELDPQPRARDGRAAQAGERIHRQLDARHAVEPQTLLRAAVTGTSPGAADRGRAAGSFRRE